MEEQVKEKVEILEEDKYREITPAAVILGIIQGIIMTGAFVYAGLKLGFTLSGSTVAAIMGFVVLKGIMKKGTIIENNINQTIASGINIAGSGVIFTLPVLLIMGKQFNTTTMILAAVAGSLMGVTVIIPLRKQMIDLERLRFPSGTAVAAILKSPGAGVRKAMLLGAGILVSALVMALIENKIIPGELPLGQWMGLPAYTQTAIAISLLNLGAGLLAGRGGIPFALGGILAFWIMGPMAVHNGWAADANTLALSNFVASKAAYQIGAGTALDVVPRALYETNLKNFVYMNMLRPIGIGMLIGGALMGVIKAFPAVKAAVKTLKMAAQSGFKGQDEMPIKYIYFGLATSFVTLFLASIFGAEGVNLFTAFLISIVGTAWLALAGLIVAEATGMTDISPLSGLALIAVTLILAMTGNNVVAAVLIGLAVCVATAQCADMMQDLKTGFMVGGIPARQQMVQVTIAWLGPIIAIGVVLLIWHYGGGFGPGTALPAPQAGALQAMIDGVVGGEAPVHRYLSGALLGGFLSLLPVSGLGVLVGLAMYLPFSITLGYGLGCVMNMALEKLYSVQWIEENIVPLAAGLIVGEAITGLGYSSISIIKDTLGIGG
ncbi:MAG: OPT/YSL family transporter [Vulcanimicrobiota bacterium]